MNDNLPKLLDI